MRPLNNTARRRRLILSLSVTATVALSVAVTLALGCSQDASVSRPSSPGVQTRRDQADSSQRRSCVRPRCTVIAA